MFASSSFFFLSAGGMYSLSDDDRLLVGMEELGEAGHDPPLLVIVAFISSSDACLLSFYVPACLPTSLVAFVCLLQARASIRKRRRLQRAQHFGRRHLLNEHAVFDCDAKQFCPLGAPNLAKPATWSLQIARSCLPTEEEFHEAARTLEIGPLRRSTPPCSTRKATGEMILLGTR